MSFANLKSPADLASRRSEAARLLQVSIDNETYLEQKMKKFQDPRKIDEVPPVYKSYSELVADNIKQEQDAIRNLSELKIPYDIGSQIAQFLSQDGKLVLFNASFPSIKADIMKRYNVRLLNTDFIKNYLNRFFQHLESSYGFAVDRGTNAGENIFSSVAEAKAIIPTTDGLKGDDRGVLATLFELVQTAFRIVGGDVAPNLPQLLADVIAVMPTQRELDGLTKLDQIQKKQLLKLLSRAFNATKCPISSAVIGMNNSLYKAVNPAQRIVGIDEQSQLGRDLFSATTSNLLSQIEIQFRGCSPQNLGVLGGVRDAIREGDGSVAIERLGKLAGEAGNMVLEVQEIARDVLGDAIGQIEGFEEDENRIVRRQEYEEELADDVPDDVLRLFAPLLQKYAEYIERLNPPDKGFYLTDEGFNEVRSRGFFVVNLPNDEIETINFPVGLRRVARQISELTDRSGLSFGELYQMSGGFSQEQMELEAGADSWERQLAQQDWMRGERNSEGREIWRDVGVGGEDNGGGGGAARQERRERSPDPYPDYVRTLFGSNLPLMPEDEFQRKYPFFYGKYSPQALLQLSQSVGGRNLGMSGTNYFPFDMTEEFARRLEVYEDELEQEKRRPQEPQGESAIEFLERRLNASNLYQAEIDELINKTLNKLLASNGLPEIRINTQVRGDDGKMKVKKVPVAELKRAIVGAIIALDERGVPTILRDRRTNMLGTIKKGDRAGMEYGLGIRKLPPMNPYDKKKFLETAEGREFMNQHPREKIMDRKFIEQHSDEMEGMGLYKMTRIPVRKGMVKKRKIGGGIAVQSTPTYAEFGKYAIHLPQLHNKNTLNIKYKSLGAVPTLKPITISDDFKDFIIDTLERKSVNEKALKKLPTHEISYFERAVAGAGLLETFKMKRSNTDEEKKDLDRFTLLRGELIAGNNSDKLVKELRALIVKFLNTGRIHKAEGMNLLQELSVL